MHCWGGGAALTASSGMDDGGLVTKVNHFYNGLGEQGELLRDTYIAPAILDRLRRHSHVLDIRSQSYRLTERGGRRCSRLSNNSNSAPKKAGDNCPE